MEHLLTSQPILNLSKENNIKRKNRVLYKFQISEGKNGPNHLRKSYFIKLNSLSKRFRSISKNITPAKTNEYFPLIKIAKNNTLSNTCINKQSEINLNKKEFNIKMHKRYKSKDEIIKKKIKSYNQINYFNINETYNNIVFRDSEFSNNKTISKDTYINIYNKKPKNFLSEIIEKNNKNELKFIKLNKIDENK